MLSAKLRQYSTGCDRVEANDSVAIGILAFFWQFGNFLMGLAVAGGFVQTTRPFQAAQFLRDAALMCFSAALQLRVSASSEGLAKLVA